MTKPKKPRHETPFNQGHSFVVDRAGSGLPHTSWWTQPRSWDAFSATARVEARRMKESRLGRVGKDDER